MRFFRRLVVRLVAALLVPLLVGWYVVARFFPFDAVQRGTLTTAMVISIVAAIVAPALAVWRLVGPIDGALRDGGRGSEAVRAAVTAALRLPGRVARILLLVSGILLGLGTIAALRCGIALDVAVAGAATGAAFAIMSAMLGYSVTLDAAAHALIALGPSEVVPAGTSVRAKVLTVCYGLLAVATLLLVSVSYVRYREDVTRRYLDTAAVAQERGMRWLLAGRPADAAELVYAASSAPTTIFDAAGSAVARSPAAPTGAAARALRMGPALEVVHGGWWLRHATGPFSIVSFVSDEGLDGSFDAFWSHAPMVGLLLLASCALLVWLAARTLTIPIQLLGSAATRMASGDLTASPPSVSRDELGRLAADFRNMAQGLAALVNDVQAASKGVHDGTREMGEIGERVKKGAGDEHEQIVVVQATVEAMRASVQLVERGIGSLADHVHSTSSAVGEMVGTMEEVRRQAGELEDRVRVAGGDVQRLSEAGNRAHTQLGALGALASGAQTTLGSVSASLATLETSAVASQLAAAQAADMAEHAGGVVQETVTGIESLRVAVDDVKKRVAVLWRRSDDIDKILDFIGEVAGRTNLLSLNASIIAMQAGEHGKAFAVVAEQIRELAAQIASSTKSIGQIIRAVRDDVNGTARLIDRGDSLAANGVAKARRSLEALQQIRAATANGNETAAAIRDAVQAHVASTRDVSNLVVSVAGTSHQLSEAIQMVGTSVSAVGSVTDAVRAVADRVSHSLDEQTGLGRRQLESLETIDAMLADISGAVEKHRGATARVRDVLAQLTHTAEHHEAAVVELSAVAGRLGTRSRALAERVGKFKI